MSFVKFTLGDIRSSVRRKLDDLSFDAATIDEAANDFQFELFNDNRIRFMEASEPLSIGAGDTFVALPDDFMNLINLTVLDSATQFRDITKTGYIDYDAFMQRFANYTTAPTSKIFNYTFFGEGLRFSARTNGAYTANVDYTRSPALMVNAGDFCELPINARELMTLGTLERVMRINEDYNESDFEYTRLRGLRTAFIKNYARGGEKVGPQVIKPNRGARSRRGYIQGEDL
jgi:hypothetical protein